jgi:hypothetical protein
LIKVLFKKYCFHNQRMSNTIMKSIDPINIMQKFRQILVDDTPVLPENIN